MDRHFMEFWGKALLQAAKTQKQWEDLARLYQQGLSRFPDYLELFRGIYGLEETPEDSPDYLALWRKAEADFRESFREYLNLLGMVPREEYAELARKYEELQEQVAEQEETIRYLRRLAEEKGMGLEAATGELQKLIKKQGDQFQKFLKGMGEAAKPEEPKT